MLRYIAYGSLVVLLGEAVDRAVTGSTGWDAAIHLVYLVAVAALVAWLRAALDHARALARTDALTGAPNRRTFIETAERDLQRLRRHGGATTLVYLDIDRFKQINDRLGHAAGDRLLRRVARTLGETVRGGDSFARVGGDEFVVLLEGARPEAFLSRLRASLRLAMAPDGWDVDFSLGAVTYHRPPDTVEEMLAAADHEMYAAKHGTGLVHRTA